MGTVPYNVIVGGCVVPEDPTVLGIGTQRTMLWSFRSDMNYFRDTTMGNIVLMGYTTWLSIPAGFRPLPGRINVILTSKADLMNVQKTRMQTPTAQPGITGQCVAHDHVHFVPSMEAAWEFIAGLLGESTHKDKKVWVMGGASVYRQALQTNPEGLRELHLTKVFNPFLCDVNFPMAEYAKNLQETSSTPVNVDFNSIDPFRGLPIKYQIIVYKKIDSTSIATQ